MSQSHNNTLDGWIEGEALAELMVPLIGGLYREHDVMVLDLRRSLMRESATNILKAHRYARQVVQTELSPSDQFSDPPSTS